MPPTWTIRANERSYGPYTLEQLRSYAAEGRLAAHSLVARGGGIDYRPASDDPDLAPLFRPAQPQRPVFFTAEGDIGQQGFGRSENDGVQQSRFIIIAEMKSRSIAGLEEDIFKCGQATALMPQAWLLSSDMTINALRNQLVQKLGRIDMLFIVDATRNKAAWFNYGPEADSRIRRVWQKAHEMQATE
jgi:GYF domain 2